MANGHTRAAAFPTPWQSATVRRLLVRAESLARPMRVGPAEPNEPNEGGTLGQELIEHALDEKTRHAVASDLQGALVDLVAMTLTAKQAHWVVVGPQFRSVHLKLDELVETTRNAADEIAERAAAMGRVPDGTPVTIAREADGFTLPDGFLEDRIVLTSIVNHLTAVTKRMRMRIERIDELDTLSSDLLTGITRELEKHAWMLQAAQYKTSGATRQAANTDETTIHA